MARLVSPVHHNEEVVKWVITLNTFATPPPEQSKGRRAMPPTSSLENLDVDIARTIMCFMDLESLYNLAHAVPSYRTLLQDPKDSKLIWRSAYNAVEGVPTCPSDLTNLRYVALAFIRQCDFCRKRIGEKNAIHTDWSNRLRTCIPCIRQNYLRTTELNHQTLLANDWTPILTNVKIRCNIRNGVEYYLPSVLKNWDKAYNDVDLDPDEKFQWTEDKIIERRAIEKHAHACRLWDLQRHSGGCEEVGQHVERMAIILARIEALGWAAELDMMPPPRLREFEKSISPLATSDRLDAYITERMEQARDSRERDQKARKIRSRKALLEQLKQLIFRQTRFDIPLSELYRLSLDPTLLSDNTGLKLRSADISPLVKVFLNKWRSQMTDKLFDMTVEGLPDFDWECTSENDKVCVLDLAITFFSCSVCSKECRYPLTYTQAMIHQCALQPVRYQSDLDQYLIGDILGQSFWNYNDVITFDSSLLAGTRHTILLAQVPAPAVGIPAPTVESVLAVYMDAGRRVFECMSCSDPIQGRCVMNWRAVATHIQVAHASTPANIACLNYPYGGNSVDYFALQSKAVQQMTSSTSASFICPFLSQDCELDRKLTFNEMTSHLKDRQVHHTAPASYESIIYAPDKNDVVEACRIWPPRDQLLGSDFDPLVSQLQGVLHHYDQHGDTDIQPLSEVIEPSPDDIEK